MYPVLSLVLAVLLSMLAGRPVEALSSPVQALPSARDTLHLHLESTIQRALEVSPEVDQRETQRNFAEARYAEARASRFFTDFRATTAHSLAPSLDIPASNTQPADALYLNPDVDNDWGDLRPFNRIGVEVTQPIVTWGELSGNIRAARHGIQAEDAAVDRKALDVASRTGELYYNLLLANALDRLAQETGDVVRRAKREVQRLLDEGAEDVDQADLFKVRLTEQEYKRRVVEVTQRQKTARAALHRQLFLPDSTILEPVDEELTPIDFTIHPDSLDYYLRLGMANRPELAQAQAGLAARKALVEVARSNYYPKLGLSVSYGVSYTPDRFRQKNAFISDPFIGQSTRTGFGIRQNLNFFQTKARVEQARAELNEVRYQQEAAQQLIQFEVEQAYRDVLIAQTGVQSRDESVTVTEEWLRTEQINFDLDIGNTENLIDAVRANLEAKASYYQAVQRYNVAVLRLMRVTGVLTQRARTGTLIDQ